MVDISFFFGRDAMGHTLKCSHSTLPTVSVSVFRECVQPRGCSGAEPDVSNREEHGARHVSSERLRIWVRPIAKHVS